MPRDIIVFTMTGEAGPHTNVTAAVTHTEPAHSLIELEPLPHDPVLLLGAGSGLGFTLAKRLAREGYQILAGTRSIEHFEELSRAIAADGGTEPQGFIADITNPTEVFATYNGLHLPIGQRVHYMPVAAGGLETVGPDIAREIVKLRKAKRAGITIQMANEATARIKALTTKPDVLAAAMEINHDAPLRVFDLLLEGGHIQPGTVIVNTSSCISNASDPEHPENYSGPWFYYTVGISKEAGVRALREKALKAGASHLDVVAPEISDTKIGSFIGGIEDVMQAIPGVLVEIPKVLRERVAEATFLELTRSDVAVPSSRVIYVTDSGTSDVRPQAWEKPFMSYF